MNSPFHVSPCISSKTYSPEIHIDMNLYKTTFFTFQTVSFFRFFIKSNMPLYFKLTSFREYVVGIGCYIQFVVYFQWD